MGMDTRMDMRLDVHMQTAQVRPPTAPPAVRPCDRRRARSPRRACRARAQVTWPLFNSLQCFWPGMQFLIGELEHGVETLRAFHTLWRHLGFHPEGVPLTDCIRSAC